MPVDLFLLFLSIVAGATLQVGVGVGFSIVVAPIMMVLLGTATAVPVLLMLNTLVSAAAIDTKILSTGRPLIKNAILGCLAGIVLGLLVYPYLSERVVLALTATLLLIGVVSTLAPMKSNISMFKYKAVSGFSGLATVWAATPGPLMMFGLLAVGRPAQEARKLVQPVALVAYGVAFALHGLTNWQTFASATGLPQFALAAIAGSILGRLIGPKLPQNTITNTIRVISVVACVVLFRRAYLIG
ncbi:hypothetical protein A9Q96_14095 [Rhodobacterales bacterium 52_120_T64]|nr:hypothetical protein A9Q96_14095 [Rhodobacterales bacterium 52_120_T64]